MSSSEPHFPVRVDPDPRDADLARSTSAGRAAAEAALGAYEARGVPRSHLKPCNQKDGGTNLPDCAKVYLPQPNGRFGMIFKVDRDADKPALSYLAFGVRHHPHSSSHALTVYEIAHNRLRDQEQS